jgi:hypothetical protein
MRILSCDASSFIDGGGLFGDDGLAVQLEMEVITNV